jgi:hypothetical protein
MPQAFNNDPGLTDVERPPCPKCHGPMAFTGIVSGPNGFDIRTLNAPYAIPQRRSKHREKL